MVGWVGMGLHELWVRDGWLVGWLGRYKIGSSWVGWMVGWCGELDVWVE